MEGRTPRPEDGTSAPLAAFLCLAAMVVVFAFESKNNGLLDLIWIGPLAIVAALAGLLGTLVARTRWPWFVLLLAGCEPGIRMWLVIEHGKVDALRALELVALAAAAEARACAGPVAQPAIRVPGKDDVTLAIDVSPGFAAFGAPQYQRLDTPRLADTFALICRQTRVRRLVIAAQPASGVPLEPAIMVPVCGGGAMQTPTAIRYHLRVGERLRPVEYPQVGLRPGENFKGQGERVYMNGGAGWFPSQRALNATVDLVDTADNRILAQETRGAVFTSQFRASNACLDMRDMVSDWAKEAFPAPPAKPAN